MAKRKSANELDDEREERGVRVDEILFRARYHRAQADALMHEAKKAKSEADRLKRRTRRKAR